MSLELVAPGLALYVDYQEVHVPGIELPSHPMCRCWIEPVFEDELGKQ